MCAAASTVVLRIMSCRSVMCRAGAFPPSHCDEAEDFFHHSNDARSQLAVEWAAYLHGEHPCYGSAPHGACRPRAILHHDCRSDPHWPALSAELACCRRATRSDAFACTDTVHASRASRWSITRRCAGVCGSRGGSCWLEAAGPAVFARSPPLLATHLSACVVAPAITRTTKGIPAISS